MIIYKITHITSGRFYIGRTTQKLERRLKQHKQQTKSKSKLSYLLRKYPAQDFKAEIIDGIVGTKNEETFSMLINLEQKYLDKYFTEELCINLSNCAKGISLEGYKNRKRFVQSAEEKLKFRNNYLNWWKNKTPEQDLHRKEALRKSHEARLTPILMFDIHNNFIGEYASKRLLVRIHPYICRASINRVLQGKIKQHKSFIFIYKS